MSSNDDPFEIWLMIDEAANTPRLKAQRPERITELRAALDQLQDMLDHPPVKGVNFSNSRIYGLGVWSSARLSSEDVAHAEDLYRRVYATGGTGSSYAQEGLLFIIGVSRQPASIPFWLETLNLSRPRDSFSTKRRTLSIAALAYLALHAEPAAEVVLSQCAQHPNADVRAQAIFDWGQVYLARQQTLPESVAEAISNIAIHDSAFSPRFQARELLREMELPVPLDYPEGVYTFKVKFKQAKSIYRVIELRATQTLDNLHLAIQHAIHWDNDHLYSFFMNGLTHDERYRFSCPHEKDHLPWTNKAILGELGLVPRHKFLYYFDYGDDHEFEIEVTNIQPTAQPGKYPRVVESHGSAPAQYDYGEE